MRGEIGMTNEEKRFLERRPVNCEECGGKMFYQEDGVYQCTECGHIELDDFGKIKEYLTENDGASMVEIASATGVEMKIIRMFLEDGRIQIPKGSKLFISCKRCGCSLRSGRYCEDCIRELGNDLKDAFAEAPGQKAEPASIPRSSNNRMRYYR